MNRAGLAVLLVVFLACCKSTVPVVQAEVKDPVEGMVFLTFRMRADSLPGERIELISTTVVQQKLKTDPESSTARNRLHVQQLDASGNRLMHTAIDHPLLKRAEYPDENGEFVSRMLKLREAEFFLRVTLYGETKFIQVEEDMGGSITFTTKFNIRD